MLTPDPMVPGKQLPGYMANHSEHGLFLGLATEVIVEGKNGIRHRRGLQRIARWILENAQGTHA